MTDSYTERRKVGELAVAISPEILAAKLAAIRNLEYPSLARQLEEAPEIVEKLWFIQAASLRPGGLNGLSQQILEKHADQIGTETLLELGRPKFGKYNLEQCLTLWEAHRPRSMYSRGCFGYGFSEWAEMVRWPKRKEGGSDELLEILREKSHEEMLAERPSLTASDAKTIRLGPLQVRDFFGQALRKFNFRYFRDHCVRTAQAEFPSYLASLCNEISKPFSAPWYLLNFCSILSEVVRYKADEQQEHLAMTAVAERVFDAFEFAWEEKSVVQIFGDSRFGKTRSSYVWCLMHPGRFRLVRVPPGNSVNDLVRAIADALGINYTSSTNRNTLREKVEYVMRHSGLGIAFDEAHYLLPETFSENTPPQRLNWVRTHVLDNGNPCVLLTMHQSHGAAFKRFVKKTQYAIEQWVGRIAMKVVLPKELDFQDLVAVAIKCFPEIDQDYLELIASKAMQSESYLKAVEDIAKRARFLARKSNRLSIEVADIETAICDVMHEKTSGPQPIRGEKTGSPQCIRKPDSAPLREACNPSAKSMKGHASKEKLSNLTDPNRSNFEQQAVSEAACLLSG